MNFLYVLAVLSIATAISFILFAPLGVIVGLFSLIALWNYRPEPDKDTEA